MTFHVVNRAAKRMPLFEVDGDYQAFERILVDALRRFRVALYAYCLMPNHWHLLLCPRVDGELSSFMHWLTTTHARRWQLNRGTEGCGAVYQGRFKAIPVKDDEHYLWVCRYVERNALRAGLVNSADAWRWSSLHRRLSTDDWGWLSEWPVNVPEDWLHRVNAPQTSGELDAFRRLVRRGEPFGPSAWVEDIKQQIGMKPAKKRGRPPRIHSSTVLGK